MYIHTFTYVCAYIYIYICVYTDRSIEFRVYLRDPNGKKTMHYPTEAPCSRLRSCRLPWDLFSGRAGAQSTCNLWPLVITRHEGMDPYRNLLFMGLGLGFRDGSL